MGKDAALLFLEASSRKVAQPPGVLFAKQRFTRAVGTTRPEFEVLVGILFVGPPPKEVRFPLARVFFGQFNAISYYFLGIHGEMATSSVGLASSSICVEFW